MADLSEKMCQKVKTVRQLSIELGEFKMVQFEFFAAKIKNLSPKI